MHLPLMRSFKVGLFLYLPPSFTYSLKVIITLLVFDDMMIHVSLKNINNIIEMLIYRLTYEYENVNVEKMSTYLTDIVILYYNYL